jgi:hypothetical protein
MLYLSPIYWRGGTVMPAPRRVKYWEGLDSIAESGVFTVDTTGWRVIGGSISICGATTVGSYAGIGGAVTIGSAGGCERT